jgi:23S rRNA maturation mini-RNase III
MNIDRINKTAKKEERERILGIIEFFRDELGDSVYEKYVRKVLNKLVDTIENNDT